jgi:hypothetical protein
MSEDSVRTVIDQLVALESFDRGALERIFSTRLTASDDNPYSMIYDFDIPSGPFERGDLRLSVDADRGHISLWAREELGLTEEDLDLQDWGDVVGINANPRFPPEGLDGYVYLLDEVRVSVQLTHHSRKLRSVALDWGTAPAEEVL